MNQTPKKMRGLPALLLTTLLASGSPAFAGTVAITADSKTTVAPKMEEANPLSFLGGALVFDVQERLRFESRENNFDFNDTVDTINDDSWLLQRFRLGVAIKPVSWLKIYAQVQDSREAYSDRADFPGVSGAEGDDAFDLRQAFIMIGAAKGFSLTAGRQILSYGDERLIGAFDWNNIGRTFDAVKVRYAAEKWSIDAFASSVVVPERGSYNQSDFLNGNETHRGQIFSGLYFSTTALPFQTTDVYALHLHENTSARYQPAAIGNTDFATFGLRVKSKPGYFHHEAAPEPVMDGKSIADGKAAPAPAPKKPAKPLGFDYDGEFAFQTGEVRGLDLQAFAVHAGTGYTFNIPWSPRIGLEYNFASGDDNRFDGDIQTFQNLFPTNHKFYGYMDVISWQNMHSPAVSLKATPCKTVTLQVDYHAYWLASNEDNWYRANGVTAVRPLNALSTNADKFTGSDLDFTVTWKPTKNYALLVGYSHFFAGDYLEDTGIGDDADLFYAQATIDF